MAMFSSQKSTRDVVLPAGTAAGQLHHPSVHRSEDMESGVPTTKLEFGNQNWVGCTPKLDFLPSLIK